ncbi:MAG: CBS domain-containing protein [candidate division Zixibacteria bacterium]|nr:CBS domain-containing protein [candidate division Zixibacteria bacterium]
MTVRDLLKSKGSDFEWAGPETKIKEAMRKIDEKKIGSLLVMEDDELIGIISERDMFRTLLAKGTAGFDITVGEVMTTNIVIGILDDNVDDVGSLMTNNRFRHLPIMDGKKVVGIISIGDVVKNQAHNLSIENRYLKDYISGKYPA